MASSRLFRSSMAGDCGLPCCSGTAGSLTARSEASSLANRHPVAGIPSRPSHLQDLSLGESVTERLDGYLIDCGIADALRAGSPPDTIRRDAIRTECVRYTAIDEVTVE